MIGVIDSSVVLKWYAAEPDSDAATALIGLSWVAPDLIRAEVANALWKKVQLGEIGRAQTDGALVHMAAAVTFFPSEPFVEQAFELALDLKHGVYDCLFLTLARILEIPLVTADKKLWTRAQANKLGDQVMMLSDWSVKHG